MRSLRTVSVAATLLLASLLAAAPAASADHVPCTPSAQILCLAANQIIHDLEDGDLPCDRLPAAQLLCMVVEILLERALDLADCLLYTGPALWYPECTGSLT